MSASDLVKRRPHVIMVGGKPSEERARVGLLPLAVPTIIGPGDHSTISGLTVLNCRVGIWSSSLWPVIGAGTLR